MTKKEILRIVEKKTGYDIEVVNQVVDTLLDEIQEAVCRKQTVKLTNFGVWEPRVHTGTCNRNPYANQGIDTKPFIRPWHRCAGDFKKRVKEATNSH